MHTETTNSIVTYQLEDGSLSFNVAVLEDTVWLTQKQMAELFAKARNTITGHIHNIFEEKELREDSVCRFFRHTAQDGKKYNTQYYNLDVIISVGYRVKSPRGTQFRIWATNILKQHLLNGYSVNEQRIKQIESSIEELVADNKIQAKEITQIKELLHSLIARPVIIHNNIKFGSDELESKIITLLDQMIADIKKNKKDSSQIEAIKKDIQNTSHPQARKRLLHFFKEIGDEKSDISQTIKGARISKKLIAELMKLGHKIKELI